jgi:hypothetical protein
MFGLGGGELFILVFIIGLNVALAAFVYRDAELRGREALPWGALVLVAPLIGFLLYISTRAPIPRTPHARRAARDVVGSMLARIRSAGVP